MQICTKNLCFLLFLSLFSVLVSSQARRYTYQYYSNSDGRSDLQGMIIHYTGPCSSQDFKNAFLDAANQMRRENKIYNFSRHETSAQLANGGFGKYVIAGYYYWGNRDYKPNFAYIVFSNHTRGQVGYYTMDGQGWNWKGGWNDEYTYTYAKQDIGIHPMYYNIRIQFCESRGKLVIEFKSPR